MFDSFGIEPTPSRIDMYLDTIGEHVPSEAFRLGLRDAMREAGDFPPGPGTVRRHCLANAGMRPGDPLETPRENGPRVGAGAQPVGQLLSGIESRVSRNYARVVARAREIRTERALPDTLDARLYSLGVAESELHFIDPVQDAEHERKLAETRTAVEGRLRAAGFL